MPFLVCLCRIQNNNNSFRHERNALFSKLKTRNKYSVRPDKVNTAFIPTKYKLSKFVAALSLKTFESFKQFFDRVTLETGNAYIM